jgi:hypothetical protein
MRSARCEIDPITHDLERRREAPVAEAYAAHRTMLAKQEPPVHLAQQVVPTLLVKDACAGGEALHPPLYSFQLIQAASVGTRMRPPLCSSA